MKKFSDLREKSKPFLDLLPRKERKTFWLIIFLQIFIASFDIVAIFLVGIVAILVTNYVVGSAFNSPIIEIIQIIGLAKFSEKTLIFIFSEVVIHPSANEYPIIPAKIDTLLMSISSNH